LRAIEASLEDGRGLVPPLESPSLTASHHNSCSKMQHHCVLVDQLF
jgi:hypothetical protein